MVARGWWTVVEKPGHGNFNAASSVPSKEDEEAEVSKVAEKRMYALGALTLALPDDLMSAYASEDVTDPSEVWKKLCSHFESNSMMNKSHLRNKLSALRMNGSMTYLSYYMELMTVVRSLKGMREPLSDAEIAHYLLNGLSSPFYPVKLNLQMANDVSLEVIHRTLTEHAERLLMAGESGGSGEDGSLFWMGPNRPPKGRAQMNQNEGIRCFTCNEVGHRAFDCESNKDVQKCTFCRHIGSHTENNCWKKNMNADGGVYQSESTQRGTKDLVAMTAVVVEQYDSSEEEEIF